MRVDVLGVLFDNVTINEAIAKAVSFLKDSRPHYIVTPNSEIVYICQTDSEARQAIRDADLTLPDGVGIVKASKKLKRPLKEKVAGIDFATEFLSEIAKNSRNLFLLGAKPGTAELAAQKLRERFDGLNICGVMDGYFKDNEAVVNAILDSRADVVFVCLGAPKQEKWIASHIGSCGGVLMIGLGGCLDVWAGQVARAPKIFISLGLEWFYRLLRQPTRIGRMMALPKFMGAVNKQRNSERKNRSLL